MVRKAISPDPYCLLFSESRKILRLNAIIDQIAPTDMKEMGRKASHRAEREAIEEALARTRWNRKEAAQLLQFSYRSLLFKIGKYGIGKALTGSTYTYLEHQLENRGTDKGAGVTMFAFDHVLNRQSFLFLVDLEIKKARRYQNYLGLLSLTFDHPGPSLRENPGISLKTMGNLLKDELRDTDVIGQGGANRLLVMLPYADMKGAHKVRKRLEQILHDYGFGAKGFAIEIGEVCFPTHATNIEDLLRMAGNNLA